VTGAGGPTDGGEGMGGHAVPGLAVSLAGPLQRLGSRSYLRRRRGVEVAPPAPRGKDRRQPLVRRAVADHRQRRVFGFGVGPKPVEQALGQRAGFERAAVRVPMRRRLEHRPFLWCHGSQTARPHPGQQRPPTGFGKQVDLGLVVQRADREPQAEQGGAAADDHLPAREVFHQLAAGVGI
jgi:hypothetical protein